MALDRDKIQRDGVKLLEEFSRMLSGVKETKETHYVVDMKNITRKDGKAVETKGFREKMRKSAPHWEDNFVVTEKGV
ncbi:MAG: Asp-tRNA(Asn) amidotransferase GatCAB subunit C [Candidatus Altiarchaeales archaeon]|nr:Asp-tRNA(Asn) amidotransferase GatCAB subunit C [Candidatus Altiarchaeales archaeon]